MKTDPSPLPCTCLRNRASDCPLWRSDARQQCEKIMGEAQKWLDYLDEHKDAQHTKAK